MNTVTVSMFRQWAAKKKADPSLLNWLCKYPNDTPLDAVLPYCENDEWLRWAWEMVDFDETQVPRYYKWKRELQVAEYAFEDARRDVRVDIQNMIHDDPTAPNTRELLVLGMQVARENYFEAVRKANNTFYLACAKRYVKHLKSLAKER